MIIYNFIAHG